MRGKRKDTRMKIKLKKTTRIIVILVSLVSFAISSSQLYRFIFNKKTVEIENEIYNYTNIYQLDYQVNLKRNNFITQSDLPMDKTYLSDLINSLSMNMKYQYTSSKNTNIQYNYKIDAIIGASYTDNGKSYEVWNKTYNLKEVNDLEAQEKIEINENIDVDYKKYHEEVKNFKQAMKISVDAYLYIKLTVNTTTKINEKSVNNNYTSNFLITLGDKIANVESKNIDEDKHYVTDKIFVNTNSNNSFALNIMILIISIYIMYYIKFKTYTSYNIRNDFKLELNKILKSCQDKIIIVKNKVDVNEQDVIDVKDFEELIKLSEELFKPILYWKPANEEEAQFYVMSSPIAYRYILK